MTFIVGTIVCLLVLPFMAALVGVGGLAVAAILYTVTMPFLWIVSAFRTNQN